MNTTTFGNQVFEDITKLRCCRSGGPLTNMKEIWTHTCTGEHHVKTRTHREDSTVKMPVETGEGSHKPRNVRVPEAAKGKAWSSLECSEGT